MKRAIAKKVNRLIDRLVAISDQLTEIADNLHEQFRAMSKRRQDSRAGKALQGEIGKLDDLIANLETAEDARPEQERKEGL